jgi:hypothetical protein
MGELWLRKQEAGNGRRAEGIMARKGCHSEGDSPRNPGDASCKSQASVLVGALPPGFLLSSE